MGNSAKKNMLYRPLKVTGGLEMNHVEYLVSLSWTVTLFKFAVSIL